MNKPDDMVGAILKANHFERYIGKPIRNISQLYGIQIGEIIYLPDAKNSKLYNKIYCFEKRHSVSLTILEIKNGVLIKREK